MAAQIIDFETERLLRRPFACYDMTTLRGLLVMHTKNGHVHLVNACAAEITRRERADARLGAP
jgi:hypothetical protein